MITITVLVAGADVLVVGAIALRNRRKIECLERRVHALGVVDDVIREAAQPPVRHLRSVPTDSVD